MHCHQYLKTQDFDKIQVFNRFYVKNILKYYRKEFQLFFLQFVSGQCDRAVPKWSPGDTTFEANAKNLKKSQAEDRLFEDRPFRCQGQQWSGPRTKDTIFLNYGRQIFHNF